MSPQLENGYTKIANEVLDNIAKAKLNGTQFRILMVVWRSTYGWDKKEFRLSESFLANATGIHKQQIKRELKEMLNIGLLVEIEKPTFNTSRVIGFNKRYQESSEVSKKIPVSEIDTTTGSELDTSTGSELDTQKRNIKRNINKTNYMVIFEHYNSLNLVKHRTLTDDMKKSIDKAKKELHCDDDKLIELLNRHNQEVESTSFSNYPVKKRTLSEFFGQKVFNGTALICAKYDTDDYETKKPMALNMDDNEQVNYMLRGGS
jgi:phage replication O-like protein O